MRQGERERRISGSHSAHQLFLVLFLFFSPPRCHLDCKWESWLRCCHQPHRCRHPPGHADNKRSKEADKGGSSVTSSPVHSSHSTKQLLSQSSRARPPNNLKKRKWVFLEELSGGGEFTLSRLYLTPPPAKKNKKTFLFSSL